VSKENRTCLKNIVVLEPSLFKQEMAELPKELTSKGL
jgi:hypothetical protein